MAEPPRLPVPENQQDKVDASVFAKAEVVSIAEVYPYIKDLDDKRRSETTGYETAHELQQTMSYCNQFGTTKNEQVLAAIRRTITKYNVSAYNLGLIMNLAPESVDELKTLIPALDPEVPGSPFTSDDHIQEMLDDLRSFRHVDFG